MINNRQNGRRRGRGGGSGGQRPGGGQGGQRDNGNRIDNRARGNANQLYEKYKNMAADAQRQGDRVNTEYYLQFADHYFRVLSDQRGRFEEQNQRRPQSDPFDDFDRDGADDYGDEGEPIRNEEQNQPRREFRDDGRERGRRNDGAGDDGRRGRNGRERDGQQDDRGADRANGAHAYAEDRQPAQSEPRDAAADTVTPADADPAPEPRRRGRPRKVRADEGEAPAAFDADRLPPALGSVSAPGNDDEPEDRPRRRRGRPAASEASQAN